MNLIHNGINELTSSSGLVYDVNFQEGFMKKNNIIPGSYFFTILTNAEEYKNINLIRKFLAKYTSQLCHLFKTNIPGIIIIKDNQPFPNGYKLENNILYFNQVSPEILNTLYHNALCYINPSRYEGFGLPVFEAFQHRIPEDRNAGRRSHRVPTGYPENPRPSADADRKSRSVSGARAKPSDCRPERLWQEFDAEGHRWAAG